MFSLTSCRFLTVWGWLRNGRASSLGEKRRVRQNINKVKQFQFCLTVTKKKKKISYNIKPSKSYWSQSFLIANFHADTQHSQAQNSLFALLFKGTNSACTLRGHKCGPFALNAPFPPYLSLFCAHTHTRQRVWSETGQWATGCHGQTSTKKKPCPSCQTPSSGGVYVRENHPNPMNFHVYSLHTTDNPSFHICSLQLSGNDKGANYVILCMAVF